MNEYVIVVIAIASNAIIKLVCFYLGYSIVKLGYNLITQGVRGEFKFFAEYTKLKGGLISASPGLLFLLLGVILIGYAMNIKKEVSLDSYVDTKKNLQHDTFAPVSDSIK